MFRRWIDFHEYTVYLAFFLNVTLYILLFFNAIFHIGGETFNFVLFITAIGVYILTISAFGVITTTIFKSLSSDEGNPERAIWQLMLLAGFCYMTLMLGAVAFY